MSRIAKIIINLATDGKNRPLADYRYKLSFYRANTCTFVKNEEISAYDVLPSECKKSKGICFWSQYQQIDIIY